MNAILCADGRRRHRLVTCFVRWWGRDIPEADRARMWAAALDLHACGPHRVDHLRGDGR